MFDYLPLTAPYPGLRPFEPHEGEIFFGRDGHTDRLLEILQRERFLAVIGPSGCGKSSLVRAGLLPALAGGRLGTGSHWRLALLRPGGQPLLALAQALLAPHALGPELAQVRPDGNNPGLQAATVEDATPDAALIAAELRRPNGWATLLQQAQAHRLAQAAGKTPPPLNLLILADQFEELFTYRDAGDDASEAAAFVDLLLAARSAPDTDIRVVVALTMRTDFLGHCVEFADLPEAINRAQYLTPRLKREEMHLAILGPARLFDGDVADDFAQDCINAVGADSDQLPLLQHALACWWRAAAQQNPTEPHLTAALTADVGDVNSALNQHAEQLYAALTPAQQAACAGLFRAITAGRKGAEAVRRPQRLADIARWSAQPLEALQAVVQILAAPEVSFLHHGRDLQPNSVIDLTHEALMRQWQRLHDWIAEEQWRAERYLHWKTRFKDFWAGQSSLLTGADLAWALDWWRPDDPAHWQPTSGWASRYTETGEADLLPELKKYILDSRDAEIATREAKQRRLEEEAQAARERAEYEQQISAAINRSLARSRLAIRWTVLVALLALGLASFGWLQYDHAQQAELARTNSLFDAQIIHASLAARNHDYAEASQVLADSHPLDADIPATRQHARNLLAGYVATQGGAADKVYLDNGKPFPALVGGVAVSPDGRILAAAGERGTLLLLDAASGALLKRWVGHDAKAGSVGGVFGIAFDPSGQSLYSGGEDGRVMHWAIPSGEKLGEWQASKGWVGGLAMRPDGQQLASGDSSGTITLWALPDGREVKQLQGHTAAIADSSRSLLYSPDGKRLASASYDRTARLWDVVSGKTLQVLQGHTDKVMGLDFSPDGQQLATSSFDRRILLWQVSDGQQLREFNGHSNIVLGLRFSTDGRRLYSASRDNTLREWDVTGAAPLRVWQGHSAGLKSVALGKDVAYSAANDGTLRRWPLADTAQWTWDTPQAATATAIAPDGRWAAVGLAGGALRLYALPGGKLLAEVPQAHGDSVKRIAFSPDGKMLATGSMDNTAKLWAVQGGATPSLKLLHSIDKHTDTVHAVAFSPDGQRLATASHDGHLGLFDVRSGQGRTVKAHEGSALSVAFAADGQYLLSSGDDYKLRLWDSQHLEQPPRELAQLPNIPMWASLSPDGRTAAMVGRGSNVTLLDLQQGDKQRLVGHESTVMRAIYSPDGQQLATVSADMTLRLWDVPRQRLLFTQRLPAVWKEPEQQSPLWDFDFRCVADDCWAVVPLTMARVAVYRWPYKHYPKN